MTFQLASPTVVTLSLMVFWMSSSGFIRSQLVLQLQWSEWFIKSNQVLRKDVFFTIRCEPLDFDRYSE